MGRIIITLAATLMLCPISANQWTRLSPADSPPPRMVAAMAYDEARDRLVLFGGADFDRSFFFDDTWEWDGTTWTEVNTANNPAGRHAMFMAYDSDRQVVVMYGGQHGFGTGSSYGDMWEYDGTNWTEVIPAHTPGPRGEGGMAYNRDRQVLVLYGGHIGGGGNFNDTWEYDGTDWYEVATPNRPAVANNQALVYDEIRQDIVLHGGCGDGDRAWLYDGANWTEGPIGPPGRNALSMAYHSAAKRTIVFGGSMCSPEHRQDTWSWDGTSWQQLFPSTSPSARAGMPLAYAAVNGGLIGFGGAGTTAVDAETWLYTMDCGTDDSDESVNQSV